MSISGTACPGTHSHSRIASERSVGSSCRSCDFLSNQSFAVSASSLPAVFLSHTKTRSTGIGRSWLASAATLTCRRNRALLAGAAHASARTLTPTTQQSSLISDMGEGDQVYARENAVELAGAVGCVH